jgi:hypothetical protein
MTGLSKEASRSTKRYRQTNTGPSKEGYRCVERGAQSHKGRRGCSKAWPQILHLPRARAARVTLPRVWAVLAGVLPRVHAVRPHRQS